MRSGEESGSIETERKWRGREERGKSERERIHLFTPAVAQERRRKILRRKDRERREKGKKIATRRQWKYYR